MAYSAFIITQTAQGILLLEAGYAPKGYPVGMLMNPGGKLELSDEDILSGAVREWEEEIGVSLPVQKKDVNLLGVFTQEDGTVCFVFFFKVDSFDFKTEPEVSSSSPEILSRKIYSFDEIRKMGTSKIFRAQYRFLSWFSQVVFAGYQYPIYDRVIPKKEPVFF